MKNEKVNYLSEMIKEMDKKNKLKLAIRINGSSYTPIDYDREKIKIFIKHLTNTNICFKIYTNKKDVNLWNKTI